MIPSLELLELGLLIRYRLSIGTFRTGNHGLRLLFGLACLQCQGGLSLLISEYAGTRHIFTRIIRIIDVAKICVTATDDNCQQ